MHELFVAHTRRYEAGRTTKSCRPCVCSCALLARWSRVPTINSRHCALCLLLSARRRVDSGKCTAAGACVKSPGYSMDGHYGSDQKCKITPLVRLGNLSCKVFETESTNDVLLIGGKAYSGAPAQPARKSFVRIHPTTCPTARTVTRASSGTPWGRHGRLAVDKSWS